MAAAAAESEGTDLVANKIPRVGPWQMQGDPWVNDLGRHWRHEHALISGKKLDDRVGPRAAWLGLDSRLTPTAAAGLAGIWRAMMSSGTFAHLLRALPPVCLTIHRFFGCSETRCRYYADDRSCI